MELITRATIFAAKAHDGVRRKGSGMPYILHPMEAACIVSAMTKRSDLIAAALLHDVLEDTPVTYEELKEEFGEKMSNRRATYFDYKIIGDQIWQRFRVTDKKLHAWYYYGLLKGFESLRGLDAFAEFEDLVLKVFGEQ